MFGELWRVCLHPQRGSTIRRNIPKKVPGRSGAVGGAPLIGDTRAREHGLRGRPSWAPREKRRWPEVSVCPILGRAHLQNDGETMASNEAKGRVEKLATQRRRMVYWRLWTAAKKPSTIALGVLTVGIGALAWTVQPTGAPPTIPPTPEIDLVVTPNALNLSVFSYLTQLSKDAFHVALDARGTFPVGVKSVRWDFSIDNLTGSPCTPLRASQSVSSTLSLHQAKAIVGGQVQKDAYLISGTSSITPDETTSGKPFLYIRLCWHGGADDPPIRTAGSYLSAALPRITVAPLSIPGTLSRGLTLVGAALSSYSLQGGVPPSTLTPKTWVWANPLSGTFGTQSSSEIPVIAASLPGLQEDSRRTFLSGVLFGVAGAPLVGALQVVLSALDPKEKPGAKPADAPETPEA